MMVKSKIKIALFCDREDWILGTVASQIAHHLGDIYDFQISSQQRIYRHPLKELANLQQCNAIHWISPYGYERFRALFPHKPQICSIHHCLDTDPQLQPERYRNMSILTMSTLTRQALLSRGFNDVQIVHYGVDPGIFHSLPKHDCRKQLGLENVNYPLIGFFGKRSSNPSDRKGTDILISTLEQINQQRRVGLLLSGEGWDSLVLSLQEIGVPVFHRSVSRIDDMPRLYGAIDIYLCTSRIEGGPMPVLEAMACERPVVSTRVGHVPELIHHDRNGVIVPIDDPAATAAAIQLILSDNTTARRLSDAGRQTILNEWTWDTVVQPLSGIYSEALTMPRQCKYSWYQFIRALVLLLARSWRYGH